MRKTPMTRKPAKTGPNPQRARAVFDRDSEQCVRCGIGLRWADRGEAFGWSIQHRLPRGRGGSNGFQNLVTLCGSGTTLCHGWVEHHPLEAGAAGWTIGTGTNPAHTPVEHWQYGPTLLTSDGEYAAPDPVAAPVGVPVDEEPTTVCLVATGSDR